MRWFTLLFCCLFLAFAFAEVSEPLLAADIGSSRGSPDDRSYSEEVPIEREVAEFCYEQSRICRKVCDLRSNFEDRFDGCPQSCVSRVARCVRAGCYRWREPEFLIAENFGGYRCPL